MKIDTKDLSGPQSFLISLMERFQKAEAETDINKAVASYDAKKYGPRFGLPAYCHTTTTQSAKDCLRFRVWYKPIKNGEVGSSEFHEYTTFDEALLDLLHKRHDKRMRVEEGILGVVWDNAMGCFAECPVKEFEERSHKK